MFPKLREIMVCQKQLFMTVSVERSCMGLIQGLGLTCQMRRKKNLVHTSSSAPKIDCGKTRRDVVAIVQNTVSDKGVLRSSRVSSGWWCNFLKRNQGLSLRQGDATGHVRMEAMNSETMEHYCALLREALEVHNLNDQPAQIYNVDESGMPLNPRPPKVVSPKGRQTKKVRYCTLHSVSRQGPLSLHSVS